MTVQAVALHEAKELVRIVTRCPVAIHAVRRAFDRDADRFLRITHVWLPGPPATAALLDVFGTHANILLHCSLEDLYMSGEFHEAVDRYVADMAKVR